MWIKITRIFNSASSNQHLAKFSALCKDRFQSGFSLIELMVATGIVSILATVAIPSYINFTKNGEISKALTTLINLSTRMEKNYLDFRKYDDGTNCAVSSPTDPFYGFTCTTDGQNYTWTAESNDNNFKYTIDQDGVKTTEIFNGSSLSNISCWMLSDSGSCY